jgi:putative DNA primase/helicase
MNCSMSALVYQSAGFSLIPIRLDGSKAPKLQWAEFRDRRASQTDVEQWFNDGDAGIGIVTGAVSRNLVVLDFDHESADLFPRFKDELNRCLPGTLEKLMVVQTPRPGVHVWILLEDNPPRSKVLAYSEPTNCEAETSSGTEMSISPPKILIEIRGEGSYIIAAGSPTNVNSANRPYVVESGRVKQFGV